jgi:hypothetical protein
MSHDEAAKLEKFRTIRQGGKTKGKARVRKLSEDGKVRAIEVDYADGRKEAVVRPGPIRANVSITDG